MKLKILGFAAVLATGAAVDAQAAVPGPCDGADLVPTKRVEPIFPRQAIVDAINGTVVIVGTVAKDGSVAEANVESSTPPGVYDQTSLRAVKQWRFEPCIVDGQPVERRFTQRLDFNVSGSFVPRVSRELIEFVNADLAVANEYFVRLRNLCPDRYRRADDALNAALRVGKDNAMLIAKTMPDSPASTIYSTAAAGECLFSSWEQISDPAAWEVATRFATFEPRSKKENAALARSLRALAAARDAPTDLHGEPSKGSEPLLPARAWVFARMASAIHELTQAHAAALPPAPVPGDLTRDALDEFAEAMGRPNPALARKIVRNALKKEQAPNDRALLLLALAKVSVVRGDDEAARAALDEVLGMAGLPWNVSMAAHVSRAQVCGELEDSGCFDATLALLDRELALEGRLRF